LKTNFNIQKASLLIDVDKTIDFYLKESKIIDNCDCEDCRFYVFEIINQQLEIFQLLLKMGVDLAKKLDSESSGVFCVQENGNFSFSRHVYMIKGELLNNVKNYVYKKTENEYLISAYFLQEEVDTIAVELTINKRK
jgi:hypothetical protein